MGWANPWVGLGRNFIFLVGWVESWVRNGRSPKIINFTFTECIDTDDHGVSWVGLGCGLGSKSKFSPWYGLGRKIGPTDNSGSENLQSVTSGHFSAMWTSWPQDLQFIYCHHTYSCYFGDMWGFQSPILPVTPPLPTSTTASEIYLSVFE